MACFYFLFCLTSPPQAALHKNNEDWGVSLEEVQEKLKRQAETDLGNLSKKFKKESGGILAVFASQPPSWPQLVKGTHVQVWSDLDGSGAGKVWVRAIIEKQRESLEECEVLYAKSKSWELQAAGSKPFVYKRHLVRLCSDLFDSSA